MRNYVDEDHADALLLDEFFEYENCEECGHGAEAHIVIPFLGNPFFYCLNPSPEQEA